MARRRENPAGEEISDNNLFRAFLTGREEAFAQLVRRYQRELFAYLARFTGDAALAEDVFQETFLQVYQSARQFDPDRAFRSWLYAVATNKARDALRKTGRHRVVSLDAVSEGIDGEPLPYADLLTDSMPSPEEISVNRETCQVVQTLVAELPEPLREVLLLSYFHRLPHREVADILSIPVGTVKSRLHAAVRAFAEKWKAFVAKQTHPGEEENENPSEQGLP